MLRSQGGGAPAALCARAPTAAASSQDGVVQEPPGTGPLGLASPIDWGSPGLGGLAAVLASRGKDRLALHAVVSALLAAGLREPADLALVGSGSVLEEELGHKLGCHTHHCCCCHRPHHPPHGPPHTSGFVSYLAQAAGHNAVMTWVLWV